MLFVAVAMNVNRKTPLTFHLFRTIIGPEFVAKPGTSASSPLRIHESQPCRRINAAAQFCTEAAMKNTERQAWTIAVTLFISLFFLWGGGYNTGPIFLAALLKAFGWSHARAGSIIAGLSLAIGVSAPAAGWLLDRIEARFVMGAGALIAVLGLFCASHSHGFEPLLLSVILLGIGLGASTWLPAATVVANWFPDRRGMALG